LNKLKIDGMLNRVKKVTFLKLKSTPKHVKMYQYRQLRGEMMKLNQVTMQGIKSQ